MLYSISFVAALLAAQAAAHGVVTEIQGANGVSMPGLSAVDGTPRDCPSPGCGAEADTSIFDDDSPLGRNEANGPVTAEAMVANYMGTSSSSDKRGLLSGLLGGGAGSSSGSSSAGTDATGTSTTSSAAEAGVAASAGKGVSSGLPTAADDNTVTMTFHQVNQDGAGPLTAMVDSTSGGTDASAFTSATMVTDVPGIGIGGLSGAQTEDFPIKVQMPSGTVCSGTVAGAKNVCVVKVQNQALAGKH